MKRIDRETVQRILDAADIVEVVSDFVSLKKRGANYIGLCPFHNERTPSFSVSKAKGICKCFSCGKGGSPVNFIMEHEQMTYYEALRYLAKKYHIEIKEYELTEEQKQEESERESMLAVNDFAIAHFSHNLLDTPDGRDIGLAYFRERGINDLMIQRFRLGYAIDRPDDFYRAAKAKGFDDKFLLATGLCARSERTGTIYDKYKGRVIYPIFSVSGRVIAFGGRTLKSDKAVAKYINSPANALYDKSRELYGLYQAKGAIVRQNKCILVEGYMDVISMHQVGVENVVASSGTSLTEGQIRLIHRFTENVTVIYDSDPAGIKASLRGFDMLLAEGLNIKAVLLPDGDDPDSFAQHHSCSQVEEYLKENEIDFIRFKTRILLEDAKNDPIERARVINSILQSISVIPDAILRSEYVKECSRMLDVDEGVLKLQLKKMIADNLVKRQSQGGGATQGGGAASSQPTRTGTEQRQGFNQGQPTRSGDTPVAEQQQGTSQGGGANSQEQARSGDTPVAEQFTQQHVSPLAKSTIKMHKCEQEVVKYAVRYGLATLWIDKDGAETSVLDYIVKELANDSILLADPVLQRILSLAQDIAKNQWPDDLEAQKKVLTEEFDKSMAAGREVIRNEAVDLADIQTRERMLSDQCAAVYAEALDNFAVSYIENILISTPDDLVRKAATDLVYEPYTLSKVHTRYVHVESERERLPDLVPRAVNELKLCILNQRIDKLKEEIKLHAADPIIFDLLKQQKDYYEIRSELSKYLGERIVTPK